MAKQRLENCSVLNYLKMIHDIHVVNPRVSGVKVQKYLENCTAPPPRIFFSEKVSVRKFPVISENEKEKICPPHTGTLKKNVFIP